MKPRLVVALILFVTSIWANDWDSVRVQVGPNRSAAAIWTPHKKSKQPMSVMIWLHGGMQSGKCEKGYEAGLALLPWVEGQNIVVASPSVCRDKHWLTPEGLTAIESLLDTIFVRYKVEPANVSLVGVSDGGFGVMHYSLQGKRPIRKRVMISTYAGAWVPTERIVDVKEKLSHGSWHFVQGGADRLFPAELAKPWIEAFCQQVPHCNLQWDPKGEHDVSWWITNRPEWLRQVLRKGD